MKYFNINKEQLNNYLKDDYIQKFKTYWTDTTISRWLDQSEAKRYTHALVYHDLLSESLKDKKTLDIGGGLSYLTANLLKNYKNYDLCDILAHDSPEIVASARNEFGTQLIEKDWNEINLSDYDVIIANDIFPNVDQRLALFLDKFKKLNNPVKLYLTFTCYDNFRAYKTKRLDGEEIFWFAGWTSNQLLAILKDYFPDQSSILEKGHVIKDYSLYANGRTTFFLTVSST